MPSQALIDPSWGRVGPSIWSSSGCPTSVAKGPHFVVGLQGSASFTLWLRTEPLGNRIEALIAMASPRSGIDAPLLEAAEKAGIKSLPQSTGIEDQRPQNSRKMPSRTRMVFALTLCLLAAVGMASAVGPRKAWRWPCHRDIAGEQDSLPESKHASFLTSLGGDSPSLDDLLRKFFPEKFPHDVLSSGKPETESGVSSESDDEVAIGLLQIARRDGANSTTSDPPASTPSSSAPSQSSTSSPGESQPGTSTTTMPSSTPSSTATSSPGTSATSTPASSTITTPTSKPSSSTGSTMTTTKSETKASQSSESSALTTYTSTSTDSNGSVVIVTGTTYVGVGVRQSTTGSTAKATDGLQTNSAPSAIGRVAGLEVMVGLMVGGALLA
ncbi:hypothetical protein GQ53DRAFT_844307 [Thozetella sp. PMI_491]|nr:hypothetical protein GQ53DRAFT_844307 [Thozetella sp. PMI_491]